MSGDYRITENEQAAQIIVIDHHTGEEINTMKIEKSDLEQNEFNIEKLGVRAR